MRGKQDEAAAKEEAAHVGGRWRRHRGSRGGGGIAAAVTVVAGGGGVCRARQKGGRSIQERAPGPGLVNTATESLVFLSTGGNNGPPRNKRRKTGYLFRSIVPAA